MQHTHQQTVVRQQAAAARDWAQGRTQVEQVTTQVRADQAFYNRADLSAQLQRAGVTLLPSSPGYAELFRLEATGQIFREREVLRGGSVADLLAEAAPRQAARRQLVQEQTSQATEQTLYAPKTPLTDLADYQRQLEAEGYKVWRVPGKGVEIEHLASGERFPFQQVRPGGPGAASLNDQLRAILARQQQPPVTPVQATEMLAQVLKVRPLTSELRYEAQVQQQGYQFVWGLDGQARLLHEASGQHFALAELRPNGRALAPQVSEAIAASRAETVQGRIEVVLANPQLASRWEANLQAELRALGATGEVLPLSTPGVGGQVALQYTHPTHGPQLEALNQWLRTLQDIKGVTLYEQNQGFDQPLASWPPRRGEYAQATVVLEATATRTAQARSEAARPYLLATGASVREVASSAAGTHTLEVRYHTARTEVGKLTTLLDKWQEQLPGLQVHETDRAREVRGSRLPPPEQVVELTRG